MLSLHRAPVQLSRRDKIATLPTRGLKSTATIATSLREEHVRHRGRAQRIRSNRRHRELDSQAPDFEFQHERFSPGCLSESSDALRR